MQLKYDSSSNEKKLYEELEMVKLQNEALSVSLKELVNKTNSDKEYNKNDYERKTREITNVMRNQVKTQEENNNIIKEQYKQIQKIYTNRVKELEEKLKNLTDKYKNMENKRNFEFEGYINEINLMRKRMKSYEDYVAKIREAVSLKGGVENVDDDQADGILQEMERTKVMEFKYIKINFYLFNLEIINNFSLYYCIF
jgi:type I site-specific restriction endonuclease